MKEKTNDSKKEAPSKECNDSHCPFHGGLKIRKRTLVGNITTVSMQRTAKFEIERKKYIKKYGRYERGRTVLKVHNPDCINAKPGEMVKIAECKTISKTKHFVIVEKRGGA